jgi:hypothetical protein
MQKGGHMAEINGKGVDFYGLSFRQVGEKILEMGSPLGDGKGIALKLTNEEEAVFVQVGGLTVGYSIADLICDAAEKKTGTRPTDLHYTYADNVFTT